MIRIPDEVKNLILSDGTRKNIRITFPNGEHEDICNDKIVKGSTRFTESLCSQNELKLGLCEASSFSCETVGVGNIKNSLIFVYVEIDCSSLGVEWCRDNAMSSDDLDFYFYRIPYGLFHVDRCTKKTGDSLGHRNIMAYTQEAYNNWTAPLGLASAFKLGWHTANKTFSIPVKAIEKTVAPWLSQASSPYVEELTTAISASDLYAPIYHIVDGIKQIAFTLNIAGKRRGNGMLYPQTSGKLTTYKYVSVFKGEIDQDMKAFAKRLVNSIRQKMLDRGMVPDDDSLIQAYNRLTNVTFWYRNTYDYFYEYHLTGNLPNTHIYPVDENNNTAVSTYKLMGDKGEWGDYFHMETYDDTITSTQTGRYRTFSKAAFMTVVVPNGVYFNDLSAWYVPDYITQDMTTFNSRLWYLTDPELGDEYITYKNDTLGRMRVQRIDQTSSRQTITYPTVNVYTPSEAIDLNYREMVESLLELEGVLGKYGRDGSFEFVNLAELSNLYPSETLFPSEHLFPQGTKGYAVPSTYSSAWYDDYLSKPYGRVCATYMNENEEEVWAYMDLVDNYNSDEYKEYSLSDNFIIRSKTWTADKIKAILQIIADRLINIRYMPCDIEAIGQPYLEAGDTIALETTEGDVLRTIILARTLTGENYLHDNFESN